ncbi:Triosephosphate isomerase [Phycisphaerae bacterium RAS1]|nr:Triosephosphate isomerase [Phycisphaerae bacterium RAS1]
MRRPLIAANWKMNLNLPQMRDLVKAIADAILARKLSDACDVALCPPSIYLFPMAKAVQGTAIRIGAQNLFQEKNGAFTGELSAEMVHETGAVFCILGHSERRHTIAHLEDDWMINRKARACRRAGLTPILCVGETISQRLAGETLDVLTFQLTAALIDNRPQKPDDLVVAYEPVWAIGTGQNATPQQAQEAHAHLRNTLRTLIGTAADGVRILYGGSVKPDNAAAIFTQPDVDGGLIGGASLKAESFIGIISAAASH